MTVLDLHSWFTGLATWEQVVVFIVALVLFGAGGTSLLILLDDGDWFS